MDTILRIGHAIQIIPSILSRFVAIVQVGSPRKERTMKIARIETFLCDAGWRCWVFVKVETDDGLIGWGECSDGRMPRALAGAVRDFEGALIGEDPRNVEKLYWTMYRISRQ